MQEKVFDLLLKEEDVSWKSILYELVKTEQMDPWDIDITLLTKKYIQIIKEMQEHDFRISGKILLAAAFLLKIKSAYLIDHDISNLNLMINQTEEEIDEMFEELEEGAREKQKFPLLPKQPQPRSRKVSIHDLVEALQRAMESKRRILAKNKPIKFILPKRGIDILEVIRDLYHKIVYYTQKENKKTITFTKLLPPNPGKREKAYTFIPLLHLENERKVETNQPKPFEEIYIKLLKRNGHK